jgi:hypothetical protein
MSLTHELAGLMSKIGGRFRRVPMQIGLMLRRETMRVHGPALDTWQPLSDGRGFEEITLLCCPWYFRYKLSYRDLVGTPPPRAISAVSARCSLQGGQICLRSPKISEEPPAFNTFNAQPPI